MSPTHGNGAAFAVRPNSAFPLHRPLPTKPEAKKGKVNRHKNVRMRERLQREKTRGTSFDGVSPPCGTASAHSSPPQTTDHRKPFQTRFRSQPVTFTIANSGTKTCPPRISPPSNAATKTKKPAIPSGKSPRKKIRGRGFRVSPTFDRPSEISPSDVQTPKRNGASNRQRAPSSAAPNGEPEATTFVVHQPDKVAAPPRPDFVSRDREDADAVSFLCLVPLVLHISEGHHAEADAEGKKSTEFCYWPCLLFSSLEKAMLCHKNLYPHQIKLQKKLRKKFLRASQAAHDGNEKDRVVVLPLGDGNGCCPSEIYGKPLYDIVDATCSSSSGYWTTLAKKKGKIVEDGNKVVRILENIDVLAEHLRQTKSMVPIVGTILEEALEELERLTHLDDNSDNDDDDDDDDNDGHKENTPFVPSLKITTAEDASGESPQPIRFPTHVPKIDPAPHMIPIMPSLRFPEASRSRSIERSRKRPASSSSLEDRSGGSQKRASHGATRKKRNEVVPSLWRRENGPSGETDNTKKSRCHESEQSKNLKPFTEEKATTKAATKTPVASAAIAPPKTRAERFPRKSGKAPAATPTPTTTKKIAKKKQATVIDTKARITVSSWKDVEPLLVQLGHVFYEEKTSAGVMVDYFCRPNGDPRTNPNASEGEDYFTSFSDYRGHLCANGVEYLKRNEAEGGNGTTSPILGEDDLELIAYWVRFHVFSHRVTGARKEQRIPDLELNGRSRAVKLLMQIGYRYEYGLMEGYSIPGDKNKHCFAEKELWKHLGRYGLSPSSNFEKFGSREEQMALEILIIRTYHGNYGDEMFLPIDKLNTGAAVRRQKPRSRESSPVANKGALEECNRGLDSNSQRKRPEVISPRKLMGEEIKKETMTAFVRSKKSLEEGTNVERNLETTVESNVETNGEENEDTNNRMDAETHVETNDEKKPGDVSDSFPTTADSTDSNPGGNDTEIHLSTPKGTLDTPVEKRGIGSEPTAVPKQPDIREEAIIEEVELPGTTNAEKISACINKLRNNEIVAHGQLRRSIARIQSFVDAVIESKGANSDGIGSNKSPILYVCGNPGTGKTMSTTKICKDAVDAKTESKEEQEKAPRLCHISCPSLQNFKFQDGMKKIMERMEIKQHQLKRSNNSDANAAIILILDEVDQLLGSKGTEAILKQLSNWARDDSYVLSIIGISNAVYNSRTDRLREYGMGGMANKLVFETYRKADLVTMSQAKIGFSVVDKKAHEFIAAKVANSSGDARQYLDLVEKAVIFCRRKLSLEKRDSTHTKPIVMIRDAMLAIRETNQKSKETIQSLTSFEKMTLCAGVHLARKLGGKTVQLGKLMGLTMQAIGMESDISIEEFKGVIERLQDNGLLPMNGTEKQAFTNTRMSSLLRYPLQFDLQLEDVDSALEDTLMKEDFYKRMVERLKGIVV